ncbi:MAG: tetratricopeptide repeat protein [Candidatus Aminicenantes bacterium]|nr:tetratricopeptide repeat protein [Candidatus Aminicenantes bacterium]NIM78731.1 tetratricopeptide repeat protein [Candidatus Aminicenantes bacterium]NIN17986.1 tetratricopeptide repeat protein [Candidatus Aminicenantes bacterium]NIN41886.1 tetratricopeptide repeat protein [Candidatus Aminicenantes bacterium]NIN84641.1 tetratricopeptide repeat protein [Candidatus Aminicenantes bacterium]
MDLKKFADNLFREDADNYNDFAKYYRLAIQYTIKKDWKNAEKNYKKAISLNPNNIDIHYNFAVATHEYARKSGNKKIMRLAADRYEFVLSKNPNDIESLVNLAVIYINYKYLKKFDKAKNLLEHAIKLNNNYGLAWLNLGNYYNHKGGVTTIIETWNKILKDNKSRAIEFNINDLIKALHCFDKAFQLDASLIESYKCFRDVTIEAIDIVKSAMNSK